MLFKFIDLICWFISVHFLNNVENSCLFVNSTKYGEMKVVKKETTDSRCLGGIILQKSSNESYCIAKDPDPGKVETLTCSGEYCLKL